MHTASCTRVRHMVLCALFAALAAVCSQIAIPMPWGVPINLAVFAACMAGSMLGPAAIGVPVLAGFQGGPAAIFGKTGGYAVGYILTALLTALLAKALGRRFWPLCFAMAVGCLACYALGTVWFMFLTHSSLATSLTLCVLPYLPADALKIALASLLTIQLDRRLPRGLL